VRIEDFYSDLTLPLFAGILGQSLSHGQLVAFCHELKVEAPGYRLEKLGVGDLVGHLMDAARKNPDLLNRLQAGLDRANRECMDQQRLAGAEKIRAAFRKWPDLFARGEFGPRLWAALRDERPAVSRIARKTIGEFLEEAKTFRESPPPEAAAERAKAAPENAAKTAEGEAGEGEAEAGRGIRALLDNIREIEETGSRELRTLEKTLRKSFAEARIARDLAKKRLEEVKEKEGEITRLKTALKEKEEGERSARRELEARKAADRHDAISPRLHSLEKDLRRTEHDLTVAQNAAREAALLRKKIEEDRLTINLAEREKIQSEKALREREAELSALRGKLQTLESSKKPPAPCRPAREEERLGIFVDVQNIYYTVRDFLGGGRMNYDELRTRVAGGRKIVRAIAYVVQADFGDPESFFQMLQFKGFQVKRRPLKVRADRTMKGNWDMGMALDLIKSADDLDTIALLSGDGDFTEILPYLKKKGCRVEVYAVQRATARELEQAADCFTPIDGEWLLGKKRSSGAMA